MSDSSISILILDTDQIFLLGLATALSKDSRYKIFTFQFSAWIFYRNKNNLLHIKSYNKNKTVSFNTCPDLKKILKENFKSDMIFDFLDFGGDKIDFFLDISKEFKGKNKNRYFRMGKSCRSND